MKVICIDDLSRNVTDAAKKHPHPEIGEECVVTSMREAWGGVYYKLLGYPPSANYNSNCFAPISDIDETTFERNYQKELV